jgi:hypothetical protein
MFNELELVYYSNNRKEETDEFVETRLLSFKPTEKENVESGLCVSHGARRLDKDMQTPISRQSPYLLIYSSLFLSRPIKSL